MKISRKLRPGYSVSWTAKKAPHGHLLEFGHWQPYVVAKIPGGYGGGYYDRSFAFLNEQVRPTEPLLVGIAYAFQELPEVGNKAWDVPLDFIATERELIDCHAPAPHPENAA